MGESQKTVDELKKLLELKEAELVETRRAHSQRQQRYRDAQGELSTCVRTDQNLRGFKRRRNRKCQVTSGQTGRARAEALGQ